ncbi:hypothetical protein P7C70_g9288, partial [Phenoliferia sp. Uapishka_3]
MVSPDPGRPNSTSPQIPPAVHSRRTSIGGPLPTSIPIRQRVATTTSLASTPSPPNSPPNRFTRVSSTSSIFPNPNAAGVKGAMGRRVPSAGAGAGAGAGVGGDDGIPPNPRELLRHASSVVKSRTGAVLSRGFMLKSDQLPTSPSSSSPTSNSEGVEGGVHLRGATNFRMAELGVFGVAQPTELGLRTILTVLKSGGGGVGGKGRETVWFCTREEPVVYIGAQPFVLRDAAQPTRTYALSDRAENLEAIEKRLKQDIIKEAARYGGVILVHEEIGWSSYLPSPAPKKNKSSQTSNGR